METLRDETIQRWKSTTGHYDLHLPAINQFIPTHFEILGSKKEEPVSNSILYYFPFYSSIVWEVF